MNPKTEAAFKADLARAAAEAKIDIAALKFERATLDNTWGTLVGLFFYGADAETNLRAARFFEKWIATPGRVEGSYEAQRSFGVAEAYTRAEHINGNVSH